MPRAAGVTPCDGKGALQVVDKVWHVLQTHVEADNPRRRNLKLTLKLVIAHDEARHTAPAESQFEQLQRFNHLNDEIPARVGLEHHGKHTCRPGKIALPQFMPRVLRKRWMK